MKNRISDIPSSHKNQDNIEIIFEKGKEQMIKLPKFKNIEFLRFVFVAVLIYFHMVQLFISMNITSYLPLSALSRNAYILVEFFFILSGFFLYFDVRKYNDIGFFAAKRFLRLWFVPAFAVLLSIVSAPFMKSIIVNYTNDLLEILFINNIGLTNSISNASHTWYICVLFWASLFYFCLFKMFDFKRVMFFTAIMIYLAYVALFQALKGSFGLYDVTVLGVFTAGMLRGIAGLGIGLFMGMIYEKYMFIPSAGENNKTSTFQYIIFSIAEICVLFILFNLLLFKVWKIKNDFIFVPLFVGLIELFLVKKGIVSQFLENGISNFLGKFSYSIFVMHGYFVILFSDMVNRIIEQRFLTLSLGLLFTMCGGIIVYYLIERPSVSWYTNKILKKRVQK